MPFSLKQKIVSGVAGVVILGTSATAILLNNQRTDIADLSSKMGNSNTSIVSEQSSELELSDTLSTEDISSAVESALTEINNAASSAVAQIQATADSAEDEKEKETSVIDQSSTNTVSDVTASLNVVSDNEFSTITFTSVKISPSTPNMGSVSLEYSRTIKDKNSIIGFDLEKSYITDANGNTFALSGYISGKLYFHDVDLTDISSFKITYVLENAWYRTSTDPITVQIDLPSE